MVHLSKTMALDRLGTTAKTGNEEDLRREKEEEIALIRAAKEGDVDSYGKIVRHYEKKVFWIAYHFVNNFDDARDIAQEAFLRVHRALARFDLKYNFYTWLYRIVVNLAIDHLRKRSKQNAVSIEDFPADPPVRQDPDARLDAAETRRLIHRCLDGLPAKYRTVLVLRDVHEMSCDEISQIIKCTNATTRWRLHKARELFKARWERLTTAQR